MTANQSNEHQRKWSDRSWGVAARGGNYDRSRSHLNFEVARGGVVQPIDTSETIPQRIRRTLRQRGIADPNEELKRKGKTPNRRTLVNIIFGGSRERMHQIAFGSQAVDLAHGADNCHIRRSPEIEQWALDVYRFACDKWGEDNIVGFYVHLDEMNPHIHCSVLPITQRNRFSFKELFAGKDKIEFKERTLQLHNDLAAVNERWGLGRGQSIMETGARHRSTEQYRMELRQQCSDLETEITSKRDTLRDLNADIALARKRSRGLTTMVRNLERQQAEMQSQLATLQSQLDSGTGNAAELHRRIADLEDKLRLTASSLADKRQKLKTADRQLADLQDEMDAVRQRTDDLKRQGTAAAADMQAQIRMRLTDAVFAKTFTELNRLLDCLTAVQKVSFGNDFLVHLAEKPADIVKCATYLFAGYLDGAIQFAQGSSGGRSTSDLRWGREPGEDDRRFAFRCMMQAHRMLRSATTRQRKGR